MKSFSQMLDEVEIMLFGRVKAASPRTIKRTTTIKTWWIKLTPLAVLAALLLPSASFAQQAWCPNYSMHWRTVVSGTGTAYTPNVATDQCRLLVSTSTASVTVTLPKPTGIQWPRGTMFYWFTSGSGTATLTAATGTTVNGGSTLAKAQGVGATCFSDGANWYCKP